MTGVVLFADPVCPFTWLTYRWLTGSMSGADSLRLRPMSLAVLNEGREVAESHRQRIADSRLVGRVFVAIDDERVATRFYDALGARVHELEQPVDVDTIRAALRDAGAAESLAESAHATDHDGALREAHQRSQDALGDTGGSPITAVNGRAFFGPVLTELPDPEDGHALLQALKTLAAEPAFAELYRPRSAPPIMCSPKTCRTCGKTTWSGCGMHVQQVKAMVPPKQWCEGHPRAERSWPWKSRGARR